MALVSREDDVEGVLDERVGHCPSIPEFVCASECAAPPSGAPENLLHPVPPAHAVGWHCGARGAQEGNRDTVPVRSAGWRQRCAPAQRKARERAAQSRRPCAAPPGGAPEDLCDVYPRLTPRAGIVAPEAGSGGWREGRRLGGAFRAWCGVIQPAPVVAAFDAVADDSAAAGERVEAPGRGTGRKGACALKRRSRCDCM